MEHANKETQKHQAELARREEIHREQEEHTKRVLAEAERVVAQINAALAEQDSLLARHNITREQLRDFLKRIGGEKLEREVQEKMRALQEENMARAEEALRSRHRELPRSPRAGRMRNMI
jgi:hypothetical protein